MAKFKLTYFDVRGRGEVPRLLFHAAGVNFEDKRLPVDMVGISPEWDELKSGKLSVTVYRYARFTPVYSTHPPCG